jgi:DNA-binding transcriptional regulator YiaG
LEDKMKKQYRSEIAMVMHEDMQAMHKVGAVSDAELREFEKDCFTDTSKSETIWQPARSETSRLTSITEASVLR